MLALVAIVLATVLFPAGIIYAAVASGGYISGILFELARGIDQTGNAVCYLLFNKILIKDDSLHPFGDVDETISSVIGRNKLINNLTWAGQLLDLILELFEAGHSVKSIGH